MNNEVHMRKTAPTPANPAKAMQARQALKDLEQSWAYYSAERDVTAEPTEYFEYVRAA